MHLLPANRVTKIEINAGSKTDHWNDKDHSKYTDYCDNKNSNRDTDHWSDRHYTDYTNLLQQPEAQCRKGPMNWKLVDQMHCPPQHSLDTSTILPPSTTYFSILVKFLFNFLPVWFFLIVANSWDLLSILRYYYYQNHPSGWICQLFIMLS